MTLMETHVGYTEAWECDANAHLNVQFYTKRFDEALILLGAQSGTETLGTAHRHLRYHRELRLDTMTRIHSARVQDGPYAGRIAHVMTNDESGEIAATALDIVDQDTSRIPTVTSDVVSAALPRGLEGHPLAAVDSAALEAEGHARSSATRVLRPADCDHTGQMLSTAIIAGFSDAGAHLWQHAGLGPSWFATEDRGRVVAEMVMTRLAPIPAGTPLRQVTWITEIRRKTVQVSHQLTDIETGRPVARGDIVSLIIDQKTRRAIVLPEGLGPSA